MTTDREREFYEAGIAKRPWAEVCPAVDRVHGALPRAEPSGRGDREKALIREAAARGFCEGRRQPFDAAAVARIAAFLGPDDFALVLAVVDRTHPLPAPAERSVRLTPNSRLADDCAAIARNGVWGTCVECPDADGRIYPERERPIYPERCPNFARYDHRLTTDRLAESIAREWQQYECDAPLDFIDGLRPPLDLSLGSGLGLPRYACRGGTLRSAIHRAAEALGYRYPAHPAPPAGASERERDRALVNVAIAGHEKVNAADADAFVAAVDLQHARLPIIQTCGMCSQCLPTGMGSSLGAMCVHDDAPPDRKKQAPRVDDDKPPPQWCPLRSALALPGGAR
jgi:hypothetical protein